MRNNRGKLALIGGLDLALIVGLSACIWMAPTDQNWTTTAVAMAILTPLACAQSRVCRRPRRTDAQSVYAWNANMNAI